MTEKHVVKAGEVYVFLRPRSRYWQCSYFDGNRNHRKSRTKRQTKGVLHQEMCGFANEMALNLMKMGEYAGENENRRTDRG